MRILTLMLLLFSLMACSDEWKKKDEVTGDGGRESTYVMLEKAGKYTVFLEAINRIGYRDLLDGKGLSTLFVPDDEAFQAYFKKHNLTGLDAIEKADLEELIGGHILNYAFRESELTNFQPQSGMETLPGLNYRQRTTYTPPIKEMYDEKSRKTVKVYNYQRFMPIFSTNLFNSLSIKDIASNYSYFYPNTTWNSPNGIAVGNAQVISEAQPTNNGYLYFVDQVVEPTRPVYAYIENDPDFSEIKGMYDRFRIFKYDKALSAKYAAVGDSLFLMDVESDTGFPMLDLANEQTSNGVWETQTYSYSYNAFLPNNEALDRFFQEYWQDPNANDNRYTSLEEVDRLPIYYLLESHMVMSGPAFPEQIKNVLKNSWGYSYTFNLEEVIRKEVCGNGIFIGINEVEVPAIFKGVSKPAFQSPSYKIFSYILAKSGMLAEFANSAAEYTLFMPDDAALGDVGYTLIDAGKPLSGVEVRKNGSPQNAAACLSFIRTHMVNRKIDVSELDADEEQWVETESGGSYLKIGRGKITGETGVVAESFNRYTSEGEWNWTNFDMSKFVMLEKDNWLQTVEKKVPYEYFTWFRGDHGVDFKSQVVKGSNYFINGTSNLKPFTDNRGIFFAATSNWSKGGENGIPPTPNSPTTASKKELEAWLDKHVLTLEDNPDLSVVDFFSCKSLVGRTFNLHSEGWTLTIDQVDETTEEVVLDGESEQALGEYKLTMTVRAEDGAYEHQAIAYGPHMATDCVFFVIRLPENRFVYDDNKEEE